MYFIAPIFDFVVSINFNVNLEDRERNNVGEI